MKTVVNSFPLAHRPWILVIDQDGRPRLVSLRELFAECEQLRMLGGDLATQPFSILRLLLAVLHRAVGGPADERTWRTLWRGAALPMGDIDGYLDAYRDRFDLLHPETPFYQVADLCSSSGEVTGLERLIADVPTGYPYLTSRVGPELARVTPAEAARWVVHCQAFDTSGIKTGAVGDPRVRGGKGYPIGTGSCGGLGGVFLEGQTLRETLLLNLIPDDSDYLEHDPQDAPVWERPPHGPAEEPSPPHGRLSLYTWQSRRIRLLGDEHGVTGALISNGDKVSWDNRHRREPMTSWRRSSTREKETKLPLVYVPALHDPSRALWRGLDALLPASRGSVGHGGATRQVPALFEWLARIHNAGYVDSTFRVTTHAIGVSYGTQQSVIDQIYDDALALTVRAFDAAGALRVTIVDSAADAEAVVHALRQLARNLSRAAGGSGSDRKDPPAAAATRVGELALAALDQRFRGWLVALTADADPADARTRWQMTARQVALDLGDSLVRQAGPSAWAGRAISKDWYMSSSLADLLFRREISKALPLARPQHTTEQRDDVQEVPA